MTNEKFCLRWNDFHDNIANSFHNLREDLDFSDVTLVCEEDNQIAAHRVILSACSPFFNSVLKKNKHSHPLIYMRGLKSKDLTSIVDFIYYGEANVNHEDLDGFLALANELQLKGLTGPNEETIEEEKGNMQPKPLSDFKKKITVKQEKSSHKYVQATDDVEEYDQPYNDSSFEDRSIVPVESSKMIVNMDTNNEDLKTKLESMMENINDGERNKWRCTVCGKTASLKNDVRRHVESHIEGVSHPCNMCEKVSRSDTALKMHVHRYHKH